MTGEERGAQEGCSEEPVVRRQPGEQQVPRESAQGGPRETRGRQLAVGLVSVLTQREAVEGEAS